MKHVLAVFTTLLSLFVVHASDWPQWRGPDRTGIVPAGVFVPTNLALSPKVLWRLEIGGGFSSPVVAGGKLVYLDKQDGQETAHALDAESGKELWRTAYDQAFEDEWGPGPRSTPIMDGDRVFVQSCRGELRCLNLADGATVWRANFEKNFGVVFLGNKVREGTASRRGNNGSGAIDGESFFAPVGSTNGATIAAFDKRTGAVLWRTGHDETAYSSLMVATLAGVRQVVALTADAVMGADTDTGKLLWRVPIKTVARRHAVTPVIAGDDVIVSSFTAGLVCTRISRTSEGLQARGVWTNATLRVNLSTPVLVGEHLYLQAPMKEIACADARTGKTAWSQRGFAMTYSAFIGMGKNVLTLTDYGELRLLAAEPRRYTELARAQVCGETWSHPAYANGKLYVREGLTGRWKLTCFDLLP